MVSSVTSSTVESWACDHMESDGYPGLFYLEGHKAYEFEMKRTLENFTHFLDNDLYYESPSHDLP